MFNINLNLTERTTLALASRGFDVSDTQAVFDGLRDIAIAEAPARRAEWLEKNRVSYKTISGGYGVFRGGRRVTLCRAEETAKRFVEEFNAALVAALETKPD